MTSPTPHVILIDADTEFSRTIAAAFESLPCRVSTLDNGDAALALAARDRPDLVVVAAELPKITGFVVCNRFKRDASLKPVPVLMVTGRTAQNLIDEHREMRTAAQGYLPRTTPPGEIAARGRELIALHPSAPVATPAPAKPAPPASTTSSTGLSPEELRILDDEIERRRENHDWPEAITALERRFQRITDRAEKLATLEKLLPIYEVETLNGAETVRTAERLLSLVPDHSAAVASLRRAYTRRKDQDRLAELDAHLERVRKK